MELPKIDHTYLQDFLVGLLKTPSPTGFSDMAIGYVEEAGKKMKGLTMKRTRKGGLLITMKGTAADAPRALTAHVDTLGAMVKEIKSSGRLKLSMLGGYAWNSVEAEGCTVFTGTGKQIRGSLLTDKASVHVYGRQAELKREDDTMEVRLDETVTNADETRSLGIRVGDFVAFDARVEVTNGFVRSRHLDDKAGVACVMAAFQAMANSGQTPVQTTHFLVSNYEEVGHGAASGIPVEAVELLAVDMAAIGDGQASDEYHATLCVKDSGGPYHHGFGQRLRALAEQYEIPYKVDIYPQYGSDGEAYWRAGGDVAVALIGPGVDASHHYERTHMDALTATTQWVLAYLLN